MHIRATVLVVYAEEGNNDGNNGDSGNEEKRGERERAHLHDIIQQEREKRGRRREGEGERGLESIPNSCTVMNCCCGRGGGGGGVGCLSAAQLPKKKVPARPRRGARREDTNSFGASC